MVNTRALQVERDASMRRSSKSLYLASELLKSLIRRLDEGKQSSATITVATERGRYEITIRPV